MVFLKAAKLVLLSAAGLGTLFLAGCKNTSSVPEEKAVIYAAKPAVVSAPAVKKADLAMEPLDKIESLPQRNIFRFAVVSADVEGAADKAVGLGADFVIQTGKKVVFSEVSEKPVVAENVCWAVFPDMLKKSGEVVDFFRAGRSGIFVFMNFDEAVNAAALHEFSSFEPDLPAVVVCSFKENGDLNGAAKVVETIRNRNARGLIININGGKLGWWNLHGVDCFSFPSDGEAAADHIFLMGTMSKQEIGLHVVESSGVASAEFIDLKAVEKRNEMIGSLSSSIIYDTSRSTTVTLHNAAEQQLEFRVAWDFLRRGFTVEPRMLGFTLKPHSQFRQEFYFSGEGMVPIKYARPVLHLTSAIVKEESGVRQPLELMLQPWCVMTGEVGTKLQTSRYRLEDETQVLEGVDHWKGSGDASVRFDVAEMGQKLAFIFKVKDNTPGLDGEWLKLVIDPRKDGTGADYGAGEGPLVFAFSGKGEVSLEGCDEAAVESEYRSVGDGFEVKLLLAREVFDWNGRETIRFDVLFRDVDGDEGRKLLVFSGDANPVKSSEKYALFTFDEK